MKPRSSVVTGEVIRFLNENFDMDAKKGRALTDDKNELRKLVLRGYTRTGMAPRTSELAKSSDRAEEDVRKLLQSLDSKDVLYLGEGGR